MTTNVTDLAVVGTGIVLRPVFDPRLWTFSVQLWEDGQPGGIHGLLQPGCGFRYADQAVDTIDAALADAGARALTSEEADLLHAGLIYAKGGPDWEIFLLTLGFEFMDWDAFKEFVTSDDED